MPGDGDEVVMAGSTGKHRSAEAAGSTRDLSPPHVLREYALVADGERGAIIGPRGDVVWLCAPRWHSGAVFSALIGGDGAYAVTPEGRFVWGGYYEPGSLIWRSRWMTDGGAVECREALAFPGDVHRLVLLRQIVAAHGPARVRVLLEPRAGYGQAGLRDLARDEHGCWAARVGSLYLRWSGDDGQARPVRSGRSTRLAASLTVRRGRRRDLVLELSDRPLPGAPPDPGEAWRATEASWKRAVPLLDNVIASRDARHACAVLRGLTSSTQGMVAAVTTSLPERAEAGRNYDYRYAWIRDQCFAGQAAAAANVLPIVDDAAGFVAQRLLADGPKLAPAYTVTGEPVPDQRALDLPGYPGGFDLVGNWVNRQFQLDSFGEALLLFAAAARLGRLDGDGWQAAAAAADVIAQRWQEEDAGLWEIDNQAWTHSRLICAAGLRAAARFARPPLGADWPGLADTIVADTARHAVHPSGRWQRSARDEGLDGALLLPAVRGAVAADDPRTRQTLHAYLAELTDDGYAYRFRHDDRPLGDAEGAFLLCGFVTALAAHQQGDQLQAARWFERNRAACGPAGLFSEEYDVAERQLRGNLPQAFVHAILLECAARLAVPWSELA
jgi:hypothetical protein